MVCFGRELGCGVWKLRYPPHLFLLLQVLDLFSSDTLNVPSEEEVYRAGLSWVKHDIDGRRQHVPWVRCISSCFVSTVRHLRWTLSLPPLANEVRATAAAEARLPD